MKPDQRGLSIGIGVLLVAILLVDTQMGLGFTPWLLYVIPLGLTYWSTHLSTPLVIAGLCSGLTVVGYTLSPPLTPEYIAVTNRAMGIIMFWALACLIVAYQLLARRLAQVTIELKQELQERTQDLGRAVNALRATSVQAAGVAQSAPITTVQFKREVADVLIAESRRLLEQAGHLVQDQRAANEREESLDATRQELEQLGKQLEQLQRELLHP